MIYLMFFSALMCFGCSGLCNSSEKQQLSAHGNIFAMIECCQEYCIKNPTTNTFLKVNGVTIEQVGTIIQASRFEQEDVTPHGWCGSAYMCLTYGDYYLHLSKDEAHHG